MTDRFSDLSPAARVIWAKSGADGGQSLLAHMLDVAAVASAIVRRESEASRLWFAQKLGLSAAAVPTWLAMFAGLHDFGKAIPGFQAKWDEGKAADCAAGLPFRAVALQRDKHDLATAALLRRALSAQHGHEWIFAVSQALGAHHGYMPLPMAIQNGRPLHEGSEWESARQALLAAYWQFFSPEGEPSGDAIDLPVIAWFAGLVSVADWIGSNIEWFTPGERAETLSGHYADAAARAEQALDQVGWPAYRPLLDAQEEASALVRRIIGAGSDLVARPLQEAADRLMRRAEGPALLIVEAPMGEGKTELAYLAHLRLQAVNGHRGLYVALPTQATGNAMFDRALTFLRSFSAGAHLDIQLAHGGALLDERVQRLRDVDGSNSEAIASSAWFSQRRRALLSPYGVGTIDQALFATLNVKHHFVRLWGLANRVVVLDEVHAYDTYTSGLIESLLRWLKAMNCSVVLMSATLPARRQQAFLAAWGAESEQQIAYPRVLIAQGNCVEGEHVPSRPQAPITLRGITEEVETVAGEALAKLEAGGCGVIIANTVQRAQALYTHLKQRVAGDVQLSLFHARFPADERGERERSVLSSFGREGMRPIRALLVATQVVEQSLDIDFDFMISDLAPVDLLLQRAGRLHRHVRARPEAHRRPELVISGLVDGRLPELLETKWGFVYEPYILYQTWSVVTRQGACWQLPSDIDRLVQRVYGPAELPDDLDEMETRLLDDAYGKSRGRFQDEVQLAANAAIDPTAELQSAYMQKPRGGEEGFDLGIRAVTRLGDEGVSAVPVFVSDDGWRLAVDEPPFDPDLPLGDPLAHRLYHRQVRLSRKDVALALVGAPTPRAFAEHPLLQHLKPLKLDASGCVEIEKRRVHLDAELGIIYESNASTTEES